MSEPIIVLEGLEKRYGSIRALEGLTLELQPGPIGLLGPNGAGKSTLIKLLLGQLEPSGGRARIAGYDPTRRSERLALRRFIGYMPESDCLIPRMNGVEIVTTLGRLTGLTARDSITRAHEVLDYVGLDEERYRGLDEYSTGMKQRLKLAQALVHDPELLLLDEPTNGLDSAVTAPDHEHAPALERVGVEQAVGHLREVLAGHAQPAWCAPPAQGQAHVARGIRPRLGMDEVAVLGRLEP